MHSFAWSRHNVLARVINDGKEVELSLIPGNVNETEPWIIGVPVASDESISLLSFSPSGSSLLVVCHSKPRLHLYLYSNKDSHCVNQWGIAKEWLLPCYGPPVKVLLIKWLYESRRPHWNSNNLRQGPVNPFVHRQWPDDAFVAVLDNGILLATHPVQGSLVSFSSTDHLNEGRPGLIHHPRIDSASQFQADIPLPVGVAVVGKVDAIAMVQETALFLALEHKILPSFHDALDPMFLNIQQAPSPTEASRGDANTDASPADYKHFVKSPTSMLAGGHISVFILQMELNENDTLDIRLSRLPNLSLTDENSALSTQRLLSLAWSYQDPTHYPLLTTVCASPDGLTSLLRSFVFHRQPPALSAVFSKLDDAVSDKSSLVADWVYKQQVMGKSEHRITALAVPMFHADHKFLAMLNGPTVTGLQWFDRTTLKPLGEPKPWSHKTMSFSDHLTLSPNETIAALQSPSGTILLHPLSIQDISDLGRRLALSVVSGNDILDIALCSRWKQSPASNGDAIHVMLNCLQEHGQPGLDIAAPAFPFMADVLRAAHVLQFNRFTLPGVFLALLASLRAFHSAQLTTRVPANHSFHIDAIWPLIGHCKLIYGLVSKASTALVQLSNGNTGGSEGQFAGLLLHPIGQQLLRQCIPLMQTFKNFVLDFAPSPGATAADVAKTSIEDLFTKAGPLLAGLETSLAPSNVDALEPRLQMELLCGAECPSGPLSGDTFKALSSLVSVSLPASVSPISFKRQRDAVTGECLEKEGTGLRICLACRSATSTFGRIASAPNGFQWNVAAWQLGCICGMPFIWRPASNGL